MCNLLLGVNDKPNNEEFNCLIKAQYVDFDSMKDGIAASIITFDNQLHTFRDFFDYETVYEKIDELLPQTRLISIHTRMGTSGIKGMGNVHFFKSGDYIMAHNGFVPGMGGTSSYFGHGVTAKTYCRGCKESKKGACKIHADDDEELLTVLKNDISDKEACDSLNFLRQMPKPIKPPELEAYAEEKKFSGIAVLINTVTLDVILLNDKLCHALTDKESFGVFFSYAPTKTYKPQMWKSLYGVPVKDEGARISFASLDNLPISKGAFMLNYKKKFQNAIES